METVDIFVRPLNTGETLAEFIPVLADAMGGGVQFVSAQGGGRQFIFDGTKGSVGLHEFENDGALDLESYPIDISLYTQTRPDRRDALARTIFEKLKATGRYHMALVFELQTKLDEFNPAAPAAQSAA